MRIDTAFIPAAGFGTRLNHLTRDLPKALVKFKDWPMIENVITKLEEYGIKNIIINTHHHHSKMEDYFSARKKTFSEIILIHEKEILGTGGALKNAEKFLKASSNFLVYNTDVDSDIDLNKLDEMHHNSNSVATLAVQDRKTSRYLLTDDNGSLIGRTENGINIVYKPGKFEVINLKAFCGIHLLNISVLTNIPSDQNIDIIPVYMSLLEQNNNINTFNITGTKWKDLGIPENL